MMNTWHKIRKHVTKHFASTMHKKQNQFNSHAWKEFHKLFVLWYAGTAFESKFKASLSTQEFIVFRLKFIIYTYVIMQLYICNYVLCICPISKLLKAHAMLTFICPPHPYRNMAKYKKYSTDAMLCCGVKC